MVALGPEGRVEAAAGFADVVTGESLTVEHRFRIGSVTKIFGSPSDMACTRESRVRAWAAKTTPTIMPTVKNTHPIMTARWFMRSSTWSEGSRA